MQAFTTRPEIRGDFGVVASTHWIASAVGMAVLERGGNAFDAAVATGFTLQVVEPHLNGPGGEVPMIIAKAGEAPQVVCGQGVAPEKATIAHYRNEGFDIMPGSGLLSAVVPGAFDAWMMVLRDYGTMSVGDVLSYAIHYAEAGIPLVPNIVGTIGKVKDLFTDHWNSSAVVFLPNGKVPGLSDKFANPQLAATYRRIAEESKAVSGREAQIDKARDAWYRGFVAELIGDFFANNELMDTSGRPHKGVLTSDDMANWQASYEAPLSYEYGGYEVLKAGPWTQGPALLQQLALLKGFDLDALDERDPQFVHLVTEASKLAFADREAYYGDPDFVDVPMDVLLSDDYNDARRQLIGDMAAMRAMAGQIGDTEPFAIDRPRGQTQEGRNNTSMGEPTVAKFDHQELGEKGSVKGDTCHLDIIDRWGNMVTATPSGGWLQSSPVVEGLGFCLTNRAQMYWLDEKAPSALAPKRRPRTTLSVNMALKDGKPELIFGTPGGDQQDQWSLHFFLRHVHFGLNLQENIDAPGFFTNHFTSSFYPREADAGHLEVETRFGQQAIEVLRAKGHQVIAESDWSIGRMTAAQTSGGFLRAAANPRQMQGYAVGR